MMSTLPAKKRAKIVVERAYPFKTYGDLEFQFYGAIFGHPNVGEGHNGHTGVLLSIDFVKKIAETESTIWEFQ